MHSRKYAHAAQTCDLIVVNSEFTAGEVVELLGFPRERICVAYPGIDPIFQPDGPERDLGGPYLLTVATLERRKNLETLLEAMPLIRRRHPDLRLAVVGAPGWQGPSLDAESVVPLGYVDDEELAALYRGAEAFVYPSTVRGLRDAGRRGDGVRTPVVASAHPSLDEASGEVAIRADPESAEAFAAAIEEALSKRNGLATAMSEHAGRFTARAQGEAIMRGYRQLLPLSNVHPGEREDVPDESEIYIAGTGSFALEIVEYAQAAGCHVAGLVELVDSARVGTQIHNLNVVAVDHRPVGGSVLIGAGGDRLGYWTLLDDNGWVPGTVIHPDAHISGSATVGEGSIVGPGVILGAGCELGPHVLVGRGALIGHHARIGAGVTLNPGANIAGNAVIADGTVIGMGALISNGITVGARAVVASGAVVVRPVDANTRVQGVPAKVFSPG